MEFESTQRISEKPNEKPSTKASKKAKEKLSEKPNENINGKLNEKLNEKASENIDEVAEQPEIDLALLEGLGIGLDSDGFMELIGSEAKALNSLMEFRKAFMSESNDVEPADFHYEWSDILLNGKGHFAIEAFRESAKTQIVIRANILHALTYPQENRSFIVIICATQHLSEKKLQEASRELKANAHFSLNISRWVEDSCKALEVEYKNGMRVRIEAYGKGSAVRGLSWGSKRPDIIVIDDPQDEEDARSETVTESDWDWFLSDVLFLGQNSRIFLIGNNLGERCIIERILRQPEELGFETRRIPIMYHADDPEKREAAWPSKWPIEQILEERESFSKLGKLDIWYRNKMCESIAPTSQKFRRSMFKYYSGKLNTSDMSIYTTVDLAISQKANADNSAVVTIGVNPEGQWFVLDVEYGHYDPMQTMDAIFAAVYKWRPLTVGIETVAYQKVIQYFLEKEMPRRNIFFNITPLKSGNSKNLRIDTIQPRFSVGSVWFNRDAPWLEKIENELLAYPMGSHDDVIDALAYMEQIALPPITSGFDNDWSDMPIAGSM